MAGVGLEISVRTFVFSSPLSLTPFASPWDPARLTGVFLAGAFLLSELGVSLLVGPSCMYSESFKAFRPRLAALAAATKAGLVWTPISVTWDLIRFLGDGVAANTVSYTHLTLPTILLV